MQEKKKSLALLTMILSFLGLFLLSCGDRAPEQQVPQEGIVLGEEIPEEAATPNAQSEIPVQQPSDIQQSSELSAFQNFMSNVPPQTIVAKVNDTEIKAWIVKDVVKIIREQVKQQLGVIQPDTEAKLGQMALQSIIKSELIYQLAKQEGLSSTEEEMNAIMESIKVKFPDEEKFEEFLKMTGCSQEELKTEQSKKVVINKYLMENIMSQVKVSEQDARDYYEENKDHFKAKEVVRARYILFRLRKNPSETEKMETKKKAEEVLKLVKEGGDFAELAKKYSEAPNAEKGGDLGYFPRGIMVGDFDKQAFNLNPGDISDVFLTQFGYNILKVEDKKEEGIMPFEEIKGLLIERLVKMRMDETVNKKIDAIKDQFKIEVLLEGF